MSQLRLYLGTPQIQIRSQLIQLQKKTLYIDISEDGMAEHVS